MHKQGSPESLAGMGKDYKKNAKFQIEVLEKKVEELEQELFKIQEQKKAKVDSDEDLDIEDEDEAGGRVSTLPDIRISSKSKGGKNKTSVVLKETLRNIKVKDDEIFQLKEEIKKSQMKVRLKDREIYKLRMRIKKYSTNTNTAYNI